MRVRVRVRVRVGVEGEGEGEIVPLFICFTTAPSTVTILYLIWFKGKG